MSEIAVVTRRHGSLTVRIPPLAQCTLVTLAGFAMPRVYGCLTPEACDYSVDPTIWKESIAMSAPVQAVRYVLSDFGAAKRMADPLVGDPSSQPKTPCGSLGYAAPEQLHRGAAYDVAVDIWSVGVIAYILLSGTMPFDPATYTSNSLRVSFPEAAFPDMRRLETASSTLRSFACLPEEATATAMSGRWKSATAAIRSCQCQGVR